MSEQQLHVFTGSYSSPDGPGIQRYQFHPGQGGVLDPISEYTGLTNPTFIHVDTDARRLYSIGEKGAPEGGKEGEVITFAIGPGGALTELGRITTMPAAGKGQTTTCHITKDPGGRYLIVCSYHGGLVGLLKLDEEGIPAALADTAVHTGHGHDPERQDRPHPHSATFSPDGRYVFVCDLGLDVIRCYAIDPEEDRLVHVRDTATHAGAGPRHFAFHPDGRSAYAINEVDSSITSYLYDPVTGELDTAATVPTLPPDYAGENTCAEIAVSRDGRYVYGSNRGHDSIVIYAADPQTGGLSLIEHVPTRGGHPRHFALTPDGGYLICANRDGNHLVVFSVDPQSGRLSYTGHEAGSPKPVCVKPVML